jgi:hypothetical protein
VQDAVGLMAGKTGDIKQVELISSCVWVESDANINEKLLPIVVFCILDDF